MKRLNQNKMDKWEKLNKEFDDVLNYMTKEDWDNWYKNVEMKQINQNKMEWVYRLNKLEQLATLLQSAWTNGNWKAETPNEREMEKIMVELGYWKENNDGGNPGDTMTTRMSPTDLENERFKYNPSDENTIPMEMGSNYASLDTVTFRFVQDANCVDGPSEDIEELIVEAKSSLGIDADGGAFFVLKTKQWAIDDANEMFNLLKRCENSINAIVGK